MPTLRSQMASASSKGKGGASDVTPSTPSLNTNPLGPATPTQDHEFGNTVVTPIIRRSRRLNAEGASAVTAPSPEMRRPKLEGKRIPEGKRKAEESLQEETARKSLSVAASMVVPQANPDLSSNQSLAFNQVVTSASSGCDTLINDGQGSCGHPLVSTQVEQSSGPSTLLELVNKHGTEMQLEAGQVSVRLDFDSVEDGCDPIMPSKDQQENQQGLAGDSAANFDSLHGQQVGQGLRNRGRSMQSRVDRFLQIARDRALHFAHFDADGNEAPAGAPPPRAGRRRSKEVRQVDEHSPQQEVQPPQVDWPGPFSTARQLVNNRAMAAAARQNADVRGSTVSVVDWHPSRVPGDPTFSRRKCPSLQDLCLDVLSNNAESVVSLEGVPDVIRFRISAAFCERRKMTSKALSLFFQGEPSEVQSLDCTQIREDELLEMMKQICPRRLEKLHLGYCGRALSEQCLLSTMASPATMALLKSVSFSGAYRLSDEGLEALLQASPQLIHLDLANCSFLTNASVEGVARCAGQTLESLVLDGCPNLNGTVFVHDIVRLTKLQKLSVAEVNGITDEVVSELCVQLGSNLKELVLTRCISLTDAAIAAIGPCCPSLQVLNLAHLPMLTDVAVAHITDNLRKIQDLNVERCKFSDEAIAAFVTASGASLLNLSLNAVQQVAGQTIMALARHSYTCLEFLDLSFCRLVDDECLGLLADSCLQLQELKLYGCTQVTVKFLNGHSNANLKVVG